MDAEGPSSAVIFATGTNHLSFALTYDCIAWSRDSRDGCQTYCWSSGDPHKRDLIMDMQF